MTDFDFTGAAEFVSGSESELNRDTYLYRFSCVGLPNSTLGAFHGEDLLFIFRSPVIGANPAGSRVSDIMVETWVRFAGTGNPGGGNVTWPQYTTEKGEYLDIGGKPVVMSGYRFKKRIGRPC